MGDQSVHKIALGQPACLPKLRVHADRCEAGERVHFVDEDVLVLEEEVHPRHALAAEQLEHRDGELLNAGRLRRRHSGRYQQCRAVGIEILCLIRIEAVLFSRRDLAKLRGAYIAVRIFQHGTFDLPRSAHRPLDQHLVVIAECKLACGLVFGGGCGTGDTDRRAHIGRLDEEVRRVQCADCGSVVRSGVRRQRDERHQRKPGITHQAFRHVLVHRRGRTGDGGPHIRHAGKLQRALHRAVFAIRPVQHRDHDVEMRSIAGCRTVAPQETPLPARNQSDLRGFVRNHQRRRARPGAIAGIAQEPAAIARDADERYVIAIGIEGAKDVGGRGLRHLVLGRTSAEQKTDRDFPLTRRHHHHLVPAHLHDLSGPR